MRAERVKTESEFAPVIVTLESQEEVDSLYTIGNHRRISDALPALSHWYRQFAPFVKQHNANILWDKLNTVIR